MSLKDEVYIENSGYFISGIKYNEITSRNIYGKNDMIMFNNGGGVFSVISDRNAKKNIQPIEDGVLENYLQLKPSYFHYNQQQYETAYKSIGLIAQDIAGLFDNTNIVTKNEDGVYSVDYGNFTVLSIKAIQEQNKLFVSQQQEITELKSQLASLKAMLDTLIASLSSSPTGSTGPSGSA